MYCHKYNCLLLLLHVTSQSWLPWGWLGLISLSSYIMAPSSCFNQQIDDCAQGSIITSITFWSNIQLHSSGLKRGCKEEMGCRCHTYMWEFVGRFLCWDMENDIWKPPLYGVSKFVFGSLRSQKQQPLWQSFHISSGCRGLAASLGMSADNLIPEMALCQPVLYGRDSTEGIRWSGWRNPPRKDRRRDRQWDNIRHLTE